MMNVYGEGGGDRGRDGEIEDWDGKREDEKREGRVERIGANMRRK